MSLLSEYSELIIEHYDSDDPSKPVPPEIEARLTEIEQRFKCRCCGTAGGGKFGPWPGCKCEKLARPCRRCARCYACCGCTPMSWRITELVAENERDQMLCEQARNLCVRLGLDAMGEGHSQDDLYELVDRLKAQYHAARRYLRRWDGLDAGSELFNLGYDYDGKPRRNDQG